MPSDSTRSHRGWWWDYFLLAPEGIGMQHETPGEKSRPLRKTACGGCFNAYVRRMEANDTELLLSSGRERRSKEAIEATYWGTKGIIERSKHNKSEVFGWLIGKPSTLLNHITRCPHQSDAVKNKALNDPSTTVRVPTQNLIRQNSLPYPLRPTTDAVWHVADQGSPSTPYPEFHSPSIGPSDSLSNRAPISRVSSGTFFRRDSPLNTSATYEHSPNLPSLSRTSATSSRAPTPQFLTQNFGLESNRNQQTAEVLWNPGMQTKFEEQVARLTASANLPLSWVDNPEWLRLVEIFMPGFRSPSRKMLTTKIIPQMVDQTRSTLKDKVAGNAVTMQLDGWTGVNFVHLVAIMLTISCKLYTLQVHDASAERSRADEFLKILEGAIETIEKKYKGKVAAVVTDASGECQKAKKDLVAKRPDIIVLNCFAHQINLIVGDYFNRLPQSYIDCTDKASELISWVRSKTRILGELRKMKCKTITRPVLTRWSAHLNSYTRLLDSRTALVHIAGTDDKADEKDKVMITGSALAKRKARAMIEILEDPTFWYSLERLVRHLRPLGEICNLIQSAFCRLDTVILSLGYLIAAFQKMAGEDRGDAFAAESIISSIEKRWEKTDQETLIVALILNPIYRTVLFKATSPYHSLIDLIDLFNRLWSRINNGAIPPLEFQMDLRDYLAGKGRFSRLASAIKLELDDAALETERSGKFCSPHPVNIYNHIGFTNTAETAFTTFAKHILNISANSASCERLFSSFGTILTRLRNRLLPSNMVNIAELAAQIRDEHQRDEEMKNRLHQLLKCRIQVSSIPSASSTPNRTHTEPSDTTGASNPDSEQEGDRIGTLKRFSSLIQQHREASATYAQAESEDVDFDTPTIPTGLQPTEAPPRIQLEGLFDFGNRTWKDLFGESVNQTFLEQAELHNLLDLEAEGDPDSEMEADDIPFDEQTEQILLRQ
ncbi:hypothetical protein Agabi119p4_5205 [Agaricus bisporus var. burnettii]|uniref:DUF659 domain-containing protein n=1 Tax=Agaricus bisporus var. burnettii TaxID=192524 RepID=A0A8H7F4Q6_AGABI|nr:hypothetical protein Agabi119p4_5205 [Agaricus bisporus var. burnettii]